MADANDTIVAVATPPGRGGIGIVRVSGPGSTAIARTMTGALPAPRYAQFSTFTSAAGAPIDRGILLWFQGPQSYTGEDVAELHGHGGPVVLDLLVERALELGARRARPGEFTERAFLNGKLDLVQAEAVADLIGSQSAAAARGALRSLDGVFSGSITALIAELVSLRAQVEAGLDFPEEELDTAQRDEIQDRLAALRARLDELDQQAQRGRALREGARVVITGRPNVGKSSLLNRLLERDRAIVTDVPGTTRDVIEETLVIGGMAVSVADTAGVREQPGTVEAAGIARTRAALESADLVLHVCDGTEPAAAAEPARAARITVQNKIDLRGRAADMEDGPAGPVVHVSALTGAGIDLLRGALHQWLGARAGGEDVVLARARHVEALQQAGVAVDNAVERLRQDGAELVAEELRRAQRALGTITGEVSADELLGEIFARFCIGK